MIPMPVIVGVPRSGTTLLRMMLDSHSRLAIPPETGFVPGCAGLRGSGDKLREAFVRWVTTFPRESPGWHDFGIPIGLLRQEVARLELFTVSDGLRTIYRLYAGRFGKDRWGDKTPGYALSMAKVERVLPEAHFIHVIRDGRDVALSWRQTWFSPGNRISTLARSWRTWIEKTRRQSQHVQHYLEVSYEALVTQPETVLRGVCDFVDLRFETQMLTYYARSPWRLLEHAQRVARDGSVLVSRNVRIQQQFRTTMPPDPSRIGAWRSALSAGERAEFARQAGRVLQQLGYEA